MNKTQEIRDRMSELVQLQTTVLAKADADGRDMTADEQELFDGYAEEFKAQDASLSRRLMLEEQTESLATPVGRKTSPTVLADPETDGDEDDDEEPPARLAAPRASGRQPMREAAKAKAKPGHWNWNSFGEFASAVRRAGLNGVVPDTRLTVRMDAPTTYGNEGTGSDGGFAVPPDFRNAIMQKVLGEDSLLSRTDSQTVTGNSFTAPIDETTPWGTTGVQSYWTGEGQRKQQSKPELKQVTVKAEKLTCLIPMTDELMEDAPSMDNYLRRKVPEVMNFDINYAILQGTGVGQPLGIINSGATVSVAKEGSQTADTINRQNIDKMWNRLIASSRSSAVWLVNQDVEGEFQNLFWKAEAADTAGVPLYMPPGGLSVSPYGTLKGRPVIPTEATAALGDKGDIILADLSKYLTVRKTAGIRSDVSIHLWFDYNITAFRFEFRIGGRPWWNTPITSASGTTRSSFVTLDERA